MDKAKAIIAQEAPRPLPVVEVSEGVVDPRVILGLEAAAEDDLEARPSHHDEPHDHDHEDFDSIVVAIDDIEDVEAFKEKVAALALEQNILRVKGYGVVKDKPMRLLVQAVGTRVRAQFDRPWGMDDVKQGRMVVIAEHDHISRPAIEAALNG